jgi:predicted nuclease with TOPRIM domain
LSTTKELTEVLDQLRELIRMRALLRAEARKWAAWVRDRNERVDALNRDESLLKSRLADLQEALIDTEIPTSGAPT